METLRTQCSGRRLLQHLNTIDSGQRTQVSPTVFNVRVDSDNGDCFHELSDTISSSPKVRSVAHPMIPWMDFGSDIRYIDDSAQSSVVSDMRRPSSSTTTQEGSPQTLDFCFPLMTGDTPDMDAFHFPHPQYNSLNTMSEHSSLTGSMDNLQTRFQQKSPSYHATSCLMPVVGEGAFQTAIQGRYQAATSYIPAVPLKSCLVELDANGQRVTCSYMPDPHQVQQQEDYCHQVNSKMCREVALSSGEYVYYLHKKTNIRSPVSIHHDSMDALSQYCIDMERDFRYYFQHPYSRLFVIYFVIFCNFLIFAEDPVSHSHTESQIPIVGNVFAFVLTKYPPEWRWTIIKVTLWLAAIIIGMVIGKTIIHKLFFGRVCRLKMFHEEQGSWMIMFLTVIVLLYIFSNIYNTFLLVAHPSSCKYQITALMGISNSSFMKAAACGTWLGDFVTAWMVTDMMLQDNLYPNWAPHIRAFWRTGNTRIWTFWGGAVGMSALVVTLIVSDLINWDKLNRDFVATTELSRAYLASFILVMDLLILMQDWDFPHFTSTLNINLPGMKIKAVKLHFCKCLQQLWGIHITGKWFNYGIIFLVMILDLNMWKNQIFYYPEAYGQYLGPDFKVYTVSDYDILATGNRTLWTYRMRSSNEDPTTNQSFREGDMLMNSRYLGYSIAEKCTAFIPSVIGFFMFGLLVYLYGRFPPKDDGSFGGRLKRRKKKTHSSWLRERGSLIRSQHADNAASSGSSSKSTTHCHYTAVDPSATTGPMQTLLNTVSKLMFMEPRESIAHL